MKKAMYTLLAVVPLLAASNLQAQFVPLQAKIRESKETTILGKAVIKIKEGNYYRSSDGSVLIQWLTVNGEKTWEGSLQDNKALAFYHLDYKLHRAFENSDRPGVAVKPGGYASIDKDMGTDSVEGLTCRIIPIKIAGVGPNPVEAGKSCVSPQYDLRLWDEVTWNGVDSSPEHTRTELYAIKIGMEPDPDLFDVKSKFTVYSPQPVSK